MPRSGVADLKARIIRPLFRRTSSSSARSNASSSSPPGAAHAALASRSRVSLASRGKGAAGSVAEPVPEEDRSSREEEDHPRAAGAGAEPTRPPPKARADIRVDTANAAGVGKGDEPQTSPPPLVTVQRPTLEDNIVTVAEGDDSEREEETSTQDETASRKDVTTEEAVAAAAVLAQQQRQGSTDPGTTPRNSASIARADFAGAAAAMFTPPAQRSSPASAPFSGPALRQVWVRRPGAAATRVAVHEDELVDDAKDAVLRKYGNSLGRSCDAPDLALHIHPRAARGATDSQAYTARALGPEEALLRTLDAYFPGGQAVAEALTIEVPVRRTPRPSPGGAGSAHPHAAAAPAPYGYHYAPYPLHPADDTRPPEKGGGYFPPLPPAGAAAPAANNPTPSPRLGLGPRDGAGGGAAQPPQHALGTLGPLPNNMAGVQPLPSPRAAQLAGRAMPKYNRNNTSSPTSFVTANAAGASSPSLPPFRFPLGAQG